MNFPFQGTARSTKSQVICNENDIPVEQLYQMTHNLCHSVACVPQATIIPAPVHYAHLAAKRARIHVSSQGVQKVKEYQSTGNVRGNRGRGRGGSRGRGSYRKTETVMPKSKALEYITIHPDLEGQMYFV